MAFMNKERKAERAPAIKAILKKYGMKGSIAVKNYSTLVVNLKSGKLDLLGVENKQREMYAKRDNRTFYPVDGYYNVNQYYDAANARKLGEEEIANFLDELTAAMYGADYYDNSDAMTDYFDTSHYISINVGKWNKPYELTA